MPTSLPGRAVGWLESMLDHIAGGVGIELSHFHYAPFNHQGGLGKAFEPFGNESSGLPDDPKVALAR